MGCQEKMLLKISLLKDITLVFQWEIVNNTNIDSVVDMEPSDCMHFLCIQMYIAFVNYLTLYICLYIIHICMFVKYTCIPYMYNQGLIFTARNFIFVQFFSGSN